MKPAFHHGDVPDSPLARWDARWKLATLAIAAFGIASLNHLAPSALALALGLFLLLFARLPARWVRGRLALLAFATLPFLIVLPFTLDTDGPGWSIGPLNLSWHGLAAGLGIFCRCVAMGMLALILLGTAPIHHSLAAAHKLKVPGLFVVLVGLSYRYAFLLGDELRRIRIALRTRGFQARANPRGYRTLASATGAILVRGTDRAERVAAAMHCRGFTGRFHTTCAFHTTAADVVSCLLVNAAVIAIVVWDLLI